MEAIRNHITIDPFVGDGDRGSCSKMEGSEGDKVRIDGWCFPEVYREGLG